MKPKTGTLHDAYQLLHDGVLALAEVEQQGMRVDVEAIQKQKRWVDSEVKLKERSIHDSQFYKDWQKANRGKTINIYSGAQLSKYLYTTLGLKPKKETKSGQGSTDEDSLTHLGIPELNALLEIKKLKHIKSTYLEGFEREQVDGVLHPFYNLHLARTYRSSADSPNLQNVPVRDAEAMRIIRGVIFPRVGHQLMEIDYGQLEVRIACTYHLDPTMLKEVNTGHDFHKDIAMQIFGLKGYDPKQHKFLRFAAKNGFVFAEFYGDYYKNCATNIAGNLCKLPLTGKWKKGMGIEVGDEHVSDILIRAGISEFGKQSKNENGKWVVTGFIKHLKQIEEYFWGTRYPVYNKWKETWWNEYQRSGFFVGKTGFLYQGIMSRNDAINYPVQGAAFHVLLWSLIHAVQALKSLGMQTKIVGQIHDSIILDVYPPERDQVIVLMKDIMTVKVREHWSWIITPLEVEIDLCPVDGSWAEKKEYVV